MIEGFLLSDSLQSMLHDELAPGERVTWAGQPQPVRGFLWVALPIVLFGTVWTLFSIFWTLGAGGAFDDGGPDTFRFIFAAFGLPFIGIGIAMISAPYWFRRRLLKAAENTLYLVTDRRVIVINGGYYGDDGLAAVIGGLARSGRSGIQVQSYSPHQLDAVERIQRPNGSGDLLFGKPELEYRVNDRPRTLRTGFFSIPEVRAAERALKELAERNRSEPDRD